MRPEEVSGIELARRYWLEVVQPVVDSEVPESQRAVALLGHGSEVLGFDTSQSRDHGWGPRLLVFVPGGTGNELLDRLDQKIDRAIPDSFRGYPTRFPARDGDVARHQVRVMELPKFFTHYLGFSPSAAITTQDWLATPTQLLRTVTSGAVFADGPGELSEARRLLAWYPDDIWVYLLGCQWRRLDQEEPFVGRCHQLHDELGERVIAARLVRDLMRLCFLLERQYAPYAKWLGTAFNQLGCAPELGPLLRSSLSADSWSDREQALGAAFEHVGRLFNHLGLVPAQEPTLRPFYSRPFRVLGSGRFADACLTVTPLRDLGWAGAIDQYIDSTDVLASPRP